MGYGIKLTEAQWDELDRLRLTHPSKVVYRNCLIILLSHSRQTIAAIARQVGCGTDTVARIRRLYRHGGATALIPGQSTGRPCRATAAYRKLLCQAVQTSPLTLGYGFTAWSAGRLAQHLARRTGITYSDDQIRRLLHQEGFSFRRPKHTLKGKRDEAACEKARKKLSRLKKTPRKTVRRKY